MNKKLKYYFHTYNKLSSYIFIFFDINFFYNLFSCLRANTILSTGLDFQTSQTSAVRKKKSRFSVSCQIFYYKNSDRPAVHLKK